MPLDRLQYPRRATPCAGADLGILDLGESVDAELGLVLASAGQLGAARLQLALSRMRKAPGLVRAALAEGSELHPFTAF